MIGIVIGGIILALAALILVRRLVQFLRTKGTSACSNCPYSGSCCGGSCASAKKIRKN